MNTHEIITTVITISFVVAALVSGYLRMPWDHMDINDRK